MTSDEYFEELISILGDDQRELTDHRLAELSDLTTDQQSALEQAWPAVPLERRRQIFIRLGALARDDIEFLFDRVNVIGLGDADTGVRRMAIANLWESEEVEIGRRLLQMLQREKDDEVRQAAIDALGRFVYLGEVRRIPDSLPRDIRAELRQLLLDNPGGELYRHALEALAYTDDEVIRGEIDRLLSAGQDDDLRTAAVAMGRTADRRWAEQIQALLLHPAPAVRREAARAAGEVSLEPATDQLIELVEDGDQQVRLAAIWALGQVGGEAARTTLLELQESDLDSELAQELDEALDFIAFLDSTPDLGPESFFGGSA